jgi:hypothetical protein
MLGPLFASYGVSSSACAEVDTRLHMDLVSALYADIRRIRVEGRFSGHVFWVHVFLRHPFAIVGLQRFPGAPFERSLPVVATPSSIVACILAFHRWVSGTKARVRCFSVGCAMAKRAA